VGIVLHQWKDLFNVYYSLA